MRGKPHNDRLFTRWIVLPAPGKHSSLAPLAAHSAHELGIWQIRQRNVYNAAVSGPVTTYGHHHLHHGRHHRHSLDCGSLQQQQHIIESDRCTTNTTWAPAPAVLEAAPLLQSHQPLKLEAAYEREHKQAGNDSSRHGTHALVHAHGNSQPLTAEASSLTWCRAC